MAEALQFPINLPTDDVVRATLAAQLSNQLAETTLDEILCRQNKMVYKHQEDQDDVAPVSIDPDHPGRQCGPRIARVLSFWGLSLKKIPFRLERFYFRFFKINGVMGCFSGTIGVPRWNMCTLVTWGSGGFLNWGPGGGFCCLPSLCPI
jgi:hypothetical protein